VPSYGRVPVEQATKFEFAIHLKTAELLSDLRTDEVMEWRCCVHEFAVGTKLPFLDVRHLVATEGKPDVGERAGFGRD
jgi:hypothetical protein